MTAHIYSVFSVQTVPYPAADGIGIVLTEKTVIGIVSGYEHLPIVVSAVVPLINTPVEVSHGAVADIPTSRLDYTSDERYTLGYVLKIDLIRVHGYMQTDGKEFLSHADEPKQGGPVAYHEEIINVSAVADIPKQQEYQEIEYREVEIGKYLAREIADGQTSATAVKQ